MTIQVPRPNTPDKRFVDRDESAGTQGTIVTAAYLNAVSDAIEQLKNATVVVVDSLTSNSTDNAVSANQAMLLKKDIDALNEILQSGDTTLDDLQAIVSFIKQNKTTLESLGVANIAGLSDALAAKADITALAAKADITALAAKADVTALAAKADVTALAAKADVTALTGFDEMPLFSISPPGYYHGGMSEKWTIANGAGITIADYFTQQQVDDYLSSNFVTNWNASVSNIDTATVATIRQESGLLYIPDLVSWGAYFATANSNGGIFGDAIRNITGKMRLLDIWGPDVSYGALYHNNEHAGYLSGLQQNTGYESEYIGFDASRTVPTAAVNRPQTLQYIPYFKIK